MTQSYHQASAEKRVLPDVSEVREKYPLWDGLMAYFPAALCEVARWSTVGNAKHNPGEPLHWAREKSQDHKNKIMRHLLDADKVDSDGFVEATGAAWRSLALLQTILEQRGWAEGENGRWQRDGLPKDSRRGERLAEIRPATASPTVCELPSQAIAQKDPVPVFTNAGVALRD